MTNSYARLYDITWRTANRLRRTGQLEVYRELKSSERLPREQLDAMQWEKARRLIEHAYRHVPFYRRQFDEARIDLRDIRSLEDYRRLPMLTRDDLQQSREELRADNVAREAIIADSTGGSTGKPVHFYVDANYRLHATTAQRIQDEWTGYRRGERHAFLWGAKIDLQRERQSAKARITNALKRNLFLNCFEMDDATMRRYAAILTAFRPRLLTGYVLALQILARFIEREGLPVPDVGAIQTGAEPLRDPQRKIIGAGFRAPVFERYGGRDIGAIAHECEAHAGMHLFPLTYLVECEVGGRPACSGEVGELIITHLDNYGAPFIRYRSEDRGVLSDRQCPCGRTYPILERVEGRILDIIRGINGRILPGEFFPHFFKDFDIGEFQVVQKKLDLIRISMVHGKAFQSSDQQKIAATIRSYLGEATRVEIEMVDSIPKTPSGKFRVAICEIGDEVRPS